jgi:hypothetical protein
VDLAALHFGALAELKYYLGAYIFNTLNEDNEDSPKSSFSGGPNLYRIPMVWCRADGAPEKP